jgi:cytochrome o ubiquinol oxidase operon protein cyoD
MNVANESVVGHAPHGAHGGHAHGGGHGATHKSYLIGFLLAIIMTAIPFALVMEHAVAGTPLVIAFFAIAQIVVHVTYFLHVNGSPEQRWNLTALLYTAVVVCIIIGGSLWIMYHLDLNMMPGMPHGRVP